MTSVVEPVPPLCVETVGFTIDLTDEITSVNDEFVEFAASNGWQMTAEDVVGTSLWDHVRGDRLISLQRVLLRAVRSNATSMNLPMRCDSPTERRWVTIVFRSLEGGSVEISGHLERTEARPYQPMIEAPMGSGAGHQVICSWCARFKVGEDWMEVEEAAEALGMFAGAPVPATSHSICDRCAAELERASDARRD